MSYRTRERRSQRELRQNKVVFCSPLSPSLVHHNLVHKNSFLQTWSLFLLQMVYPFHFRRRLGHLPHSLFKVTSLSSFAGADQLMPSKQRKDIYSANAVQRLLIITMYTKQPSSSQRGRLCKDRTRFAWPSAHRQRSHKITAQTDVSAP